MPSVDVYWSGQCPNPDIQEKLCRNLKSLAELSHSYFKEKEPIKYFDCEIEGNILIEGSLVDRNLNKKLKCEGIRKIVHRYTEKRDREVDKLLDVIFGTTTKPKKIKETFYSVNKARLYGIEFLLYDPRGRDYGDRVSFVFLRLDSCAELNGRLVYVEDHDECKCYRSKKIKESDWYLTDPYVHLRYFCEEWMDRLISWVKYFYVPNLHYWRYGDLPGYEDFSKSIDQNNIGEFNLEKMAKQILNSLKSELREEIRAWIERWGVRKSDEDNQE